MCLLGLYRSIPSIRKFSQKSSDIETKSQQKEVTVTSYIILKTETKFLLKNIFLRITGSYDSQNWEVCPILPNCSWSSHNLLPKSCYLIKSFINKVIQFLYKGWCLVHSCIKWCLCNIHSGTSSGDLKPEEKFSLSVPQTAECVNSYHTHISTYKLFHKHTTFSSLTILYLPGQV